MGEQRLRVLRQSLKRCCTRSSWLAGTDIVLIGCPPSTVEWTADDTNSISKIHAALPKGHAVPLKNRNRSYAGSALPEDYARRTVTKAQAQLIQSNCPSATKNLSAVARRRVSDRKEL